VRAYGYAEPYVHKSEYWTTELFAAGTDPANMALNKVAEQSSTYMTWEAALAVDDDLNTIACTGHVSSPEPWWSVDLGEPMDVAHVTITNDINDLYG